MFVQPAFSEPEHHLGRALFLSIESRFAEKILSGQKTIELRRKFPAISEAPINALVYSSKRQKSLIGECIIRSSKKLDLSTIWNEHSSESAISKEDFDTYFAGRTEGYAVSISAVRRFCRSLTCAELKNEWAFAIPQSYRYISSHLYRALVAATA